MSIGAFVQENPINTDEIAHILSPFGINPLAFSIGMKHHRLVITAEYGPEEETGGLIIGESYLARKMFERLMQENNISFMFDKSQLEKPVTLTMKILLVKNDFPFDESEKDLYNLFAPQSIRTVQFIILMMAYEGIELTLGGILERGFRLQSNALPAILSKDSIILVISGPNLPEHNLPQFAWTTPMSPLPVAPSPIQMTSMPPPNTKRPDKVSIPMASSMPPPRRPEEDVDGDGFTRVSDGICRFPAYFSKGKTCVRGQILDDEVIYRNYTTRVNEKHHTVAGLGPLDPRFRKEMEERLGPMHFAKWVKFYPINSQ
jgi:hypothetical protein